MYLIPSVSVTHESSICKSLLFMTVSSWNWNLYWIKNISKSTIWCCSGALPGWCEQNFWFNEILNRLCLFVLWPLFSSSLFSFVHLFFPLQCATSMSHFFVHDGLRSWDISFIRDGSSHSAEKNVDLASKERNYMWCSSHAIHCMHFWHPLWELK